MLTDAQNLVSLWGDAEVDESARPPEPGVDASEEELAAHQAYQVGVEESQLAGQRVRDQVTNYLGSAGECRYALASYFHAITPDDAAWQDTQLYADSTPTRVACLEGVWDHVVAEDASLAGELEGVGSDPEKQFVWITALKARSAELLQEAAATAAPEEGGQVAAASAAPESSGPVETAASAPVTWSADWGMFLRFENGAYQYSLSQVLSDVPGTAEPTGQPDGTWCDTLEPRPPGRTGRNSDPLSTNSLPILTWNSTTRISSWRWRPRASRSRSIKPFEISKPELSRRSDLVTAPPLLLTASTEGAHDERY